MLIGHYASAFVIKKHFKEVPLWTLFLSCQLMDFLFFIYCILGLEHFEILPGIVGPQSLILDSHQISHSLLSAAFYSIIIFLIALNTY